MIEPQAPPRQLLPPARVWIPGALAILVLTVAVYIPSIRGDYVWDDDVHLFENPHMTKPGGFAKLWTDAQFYYPLTSTAFWIERRVFGDVDKPPGEIDTTPYHLVNVLLHAANSILLWLLLWRLAVPGAWVAGAVFALHPVNVQSVAWITELKNCQSGFFYLLALHAWVGFRERDRWSWFAGTVALFIGALLSKTSTVVLPFALIAIDLWRREKIDVKNLAQWLCFFALSLAAGLLTVYLHREHVSSTAEFLDTYPERIVIAGKAVWFYLSKAFWPTNLSFVYPRWEIDASSIASYFPFAAVVFVSIVLLAAWRRIGRAPFVAWAYYVCALIPVMGFFKMYYTRYSYVADHWQYLALMGWAAFVVGAVAHVLKKVRAKYGVTALAMGATAAACVLAILMTLSWRQAGVYAGPRQLWEDVLAKNPDSWMAHNNYANDLRDEANRLRESGQLERANALYFRAIEHYDRALALRPNFGEAHFNKSLALLAHERYAEAYFHLQETLKLNAVHAPVYYNLANLEALQGRISEAHDHYEAAIRLNPDYAEAHRDLGLLYIRQNDFENARAHLERSLEIDPNQSSVLANLGGVTMKLGEIETAKGYLEAAIRIDPKNALAHYHLSKALALLGDNQAAQAHGNEALRLAPDRFAEK